MTPFKLRGSKEEKRKEKQGAGAPWAPGTGVGAGSAGAGGTGGLELAASAPAPLASLSTSSPSLSALLQLMTKATGLTTVAATRFGVAALALTGGTIVAAVSLFLNSGPSATRPSFGPGVFERPGDAGGRLSRSYQAPDLVGTGSRGPATSGLDMFADANPLSDELASEEELPADSSAPADQAKAPLAIPDSSPKAPTGGSTPWDKPKMKPGKGLPGHAAGKSQVTLQAVPSLSGKVGNNFQDIYRKTTSGFSASRQALGARGRSTVIQKGGKAFPQLQSVSRMSRQGALMSNADGASQTASSAFDASSSKGPTLGMTSSAAAAKAGAGNPPDMKSVTAMTPPPAPDKDAENKTPYQNLIYAGMAALMIGQMLVQAAGSMASAAQKAPDPASKMNYVNAARALAAAAMGAGGGAAGAGAALSSEYEQMTQAMPFIIGGAVIIAQAAIVLVKAEQAAQEAQQGVAGAGEAAQGASDAALQPPQIPPMGDNEDKEEPPKKPEPPPAPTGRQVDDTQPNFSGNLPDS